MADPKPVSQAVEEKETTQEQVESASSAGKEYWRDIIPKNLHGAVEEYGITTILENPYIAGLLGFSADIVSDLQQVARDLKDNIAGPDQISFKVQDKAVTGNDDRNNAHKESLRYPLDIKNAETEYMLFQFYRYEPPFGRGGVGSQNFLRVFSQQSTGEYGTLEEYNLATTNLSIDTQLNQVVLYIPPDVQSSYGATWNAQEFSNTAVAKIRGGMALRRGDIAGAAAGQLENLGNSIGRMPEMKGADFIRGEIAKTTGETLTRNNLFASAAGVVTNPNIELLYDSPQMRTIDFTWKLVPNNKDEAEVIFEIVRTFKLCMHPSFGRPGRQQGGKVSGAGAVVNTFNDARTKVGFISVPSVCKFVFMKGNNMHPFLPQYKTCALVGVDVNYTSDNGYVVTRDGYPVSTELRLSFKELKLVYREDIAPVRPSTQKFGTNKNLHGGH